MSEDQGFEFEQVYFDVEPAPGETPLEALRAGRILLYSSEQRLKTLATSLKDALSNLGLTELVIEDGTQLDPQCFIKTSVQEFLDGFTSEFNLLAWNLVNQGAG